MQVGMLIDYIATPHGRWRFCLAAETGSSLLNTRMMLRCDRQNLGFSTITRGLKHVAANLIGARATDAFDLWSGTVQSFARAGVANNQRWKI